MPRNICDITAEVVVGIRPEHLEVGSLGAEIEVEVVDELGADTYLHGRITGANGAAGRSVIARVGWHDPPARGSRVRLRPDPEHVYFFAADGRRIR